MKNPKLIPTPFANSGSKDQIPQYKTPAMADEKASWETGFPDLTMNPVYSGGLPPDGKDFNGVLNQISENIVFLSKGGRFKFDPEYAASIGGYSKGATLQSNDENVEYQSLIDNNLVDFNTASPEVIAVAWRITGLGDAGPVLNGKLDKTSVKDELGLSQSDPISQNVASGLGSGIVGSFEAGLNYIEHLSNSNQLVTFENEYGKQTYCWMGDFPKPVPINSTPESTGGIGEGAWVGVGDAALRSAIKKPEGVYLVGGVMPIFRVGDHGGDYGADIDISAAFNFTADAKGNTPGEIILPPVAGILYVNAESLRVPKNTILDLQFNTVKLGNGASKYVIRNRDEHNFGGFITVKNVTIDGNRPGGQVRRYDTPTQNADGLTIYDYRTNYPGFTLMFSNVEKLIVSDIHIKDSEAWSIAHFKCGDAIFDNCSFDATREPGKNADGITGVGTRRTTINHLRGYTNDDMCAISTSRATVGTFAIFDPLEGADVESFTVNGLLPVKKDNLLWPHVGVGVYVSDNFSIELCTLRDIRGFYNYHVARFGNYWRGGPWNAPNGVIRKVLVDNVYATSYLDNNADLHTFHVPVLHFDVRGLGANKNANLVGNRRNCPLIRAGDGGTISYLNLDNIYYFNNTEPTSGGRNSMVRIDRNGAVRDITLNVAMDFTYGNISKNTVIDKTDVGVTTLNVIKASLGSPDMSNQDFANSSFNEENLFINTGGGAVRMGAVFNFKLRKELILKGGASAESEKVVICREGSRASITGYANIAPGYTQGTVIADIPMWAIPYYDRAFAAAAFGDSATCRLRIEKSGISIYPSSSGGGMIFADGVSWECGVRLAYTT